MCVTLEVHKRLLIAAICGELLSNGLEFLYFIVNIPILR